MEQQKLEVSDQGALDGWKHAVMHDSPLALEKAEEFVIKLEQKKLED